MKLDDEHPFQLPMTQTQARWLWLELVWNNAENRDFRSSLGIAALSHGISGGNDKSDYHKAADFLEAFAALIRPTE